MPKGKIYKQALEFYSNSVGLTVDTVNEIEGIPCLPCDHFLKRVVPGTDLP